MSSRTTILIAVVAGAMTIVPAVLSGRHMQRWGMTQELAYAANELPNFPHAFGDWTEIAASQPLSERVSRELGLANHITRTYRNAKTGEEISVILMVGRPGPLVRHPPDICYDNRANIRRGEKFVELDVDGRAQRFKVLSYERRDPTGPQKFTVTYGHTVDGAWDAPTSPRMTYGGAPALYKVQLLSLQDDARPGAAQAEDAQRPSGEAQADDAADAVATLKSFCTAFGRHLQRAALKP